MKKSAPGITTIYFKRYQQATIAINADKSVPIDDVVAVMRVARELGARSVLMVDKKGVQ